MDSASTFRVRLVSGEEFGPAPLTTIVEWAQQRRVPVDALLVPSDGSPVRSVFAEPQLRAVLQAMTAGSAGAPPADSGLQVLIPTRNPCALAGYYVSIASIIPGLGFLGLVAIVLGVLGLRARARRPEVHGTAHAWVAILLGALVTLGNIAVIAIIVAANA